MQYDFTLQPSGGQVIETVGRFIKYVEGTGKIRVRLDKGGFLDLLPGQGARGLDFSKIVVEDRSGAVNVGTLLAGAFEFQDDRISGTVSIAGTVGVLGTVDVIDGGRTRTMGGKAFMGYGGAGSVASQSAFVQLWNPVANPRNLFLTGIAAQANAPAANGIVLRLLSLIQPGTTGNQAAQSKKIGAAASTGLIYQGNSGAMTAVTSISNMDKGKREYSFKEPFMIPAGFGLLVFNGTVGEDLGCTFEFFEE